MRSCKLDESMDSFVEEKTGKKWFRIFMNLSEEVKVDSG